jgi:hypothetical protein
MRNNGTLLVAALTTLAFFLAAPADSRAFGQNDAQRCLTNGVDWFSASFKDAKIGAMNSSLSLEQASTGAVYFAREYVRMHGLSAGNAFDQTIRSEQQFHANPPYRLKNARLRMGDGAAIRVEESGQSYKAFIEYNGEIRETALPEPLQYTLADYCALKLWVMDHPAAGASIKGKEFDIQQLRVIPSRLTLVSVSQAVFPERRRYEVRTEIPGRGQVTTELSADGRVLSMTGQGFTFRRSDRKQARAETPPVDLFLANSVTLDKPLDDPRGVISWDLGCPQDLARALEDGPAQRILCDGPNCRIRLGEPNPEAARPSMDHEQDWLGSIAGCPLDDPQLVALTQQAVGDARSDMDKLRNIAAFVDDYIQDVPGEAAMDVKQIMDRRRGDCGEHALLFTAICRTAGLPARIVLGYYPAGDPAESLAGHAWAEAVANGRWVEADPINGGLVRDALHLRTGTLESSASKDLFPLSGAQLNVLEVHRKPGR